MRFTVIGGRGLIGREVVRVLEQGGHEVDVPQRGVFGDRDLGTVVYAAGRSSDYRQRVADTFQAHVADLIPLLRRGRFSRFVYVSSTRVYDRIARGIEDDPVAVVPQQLEDVIAASKLAGESLVLTLAGARGHVARVSNVIGDDLASATFLHTVIREALDHGVIRLLAPPESERDYILVDDVATVIGEIATKGGRAVYNVASGHAIQNGALAKLVAEVTGARVEVVGSAPLVRRPPIDVRAIQKDFRFVARPVEGRVASLVEAHLRSRSVT